MNRAVGLSKVVIVMTVKSGEAVVCMLYKSEDVILWGALCVHRAPRIIGV